MLSTKKRHELNECDPNSEGKNKCWEITSSNKMDKQLRQKTKI